MDGLIETLNSEFGETAVTAYSSRRDKMELLRKLSKELDQEIYADTDTFFKMISENQEELLRASLGKTGEPFIPKPDLKFKEYSAIKNFYSGADFERNSFLTLSLPLVSSVLWFMQRAMKRLKWM